MLKTLRIIGVLFCAALCCGFSHGRGSQTYYVSNGGNDSNDGLTQTSAWATPGKVSSSSFNSGDIIAFDAASTFSAGVTLSQANAPAFLTLTSYGVGQPTFNTGNSFACITTTYFPGLFVSNLNCVGGGNLTNTTNGIDIRNTKLGYIAGPSITNSTITGYGNNCIQILGFNGQFTGYSGTTISGNSLHDCSGNTQPGVIGSLTGCVNISGGDILNSQKNNLNITVSSNTIFNCIGTNTAFVPNDITGFGIVIIESSLVLISNNLVHDGGQFNSNCGGPVGIILNFSDRSTIQFNEVYNWRHGTGCDGEGIDLDVGTTNSTMQYNYSHDNDFAEGLLFGAGFNTNNNVVRFNVFQTTLATSVPILLDSPNSSQIYNNTILNLVTGGPCLSGSSPTIGITWTVANNICSTPGGGTTMGLATNGASSTLNVTGNDYYAAGNPISLVFQGNTYGSLAAAQAAGFEKVAGNPVGVVADPTLTGTFPSGICGTATTPGWNASCPTAFKLLVAAPAGKTHGLNLNTIYGYNVGTVDFYGNAITNTTLPIGAAANQ
jgi:hypothetical protein